VGWCCFLWVGGWPGGGGGGGGLSRGVFSGWWFSCWKMVESLAYISLGNSLLNFLLPEVFETNDDFEEWFAKPFKTQEDGGDFEVLSLQRNSNPKWIKQFLGWRSAL